MITPINKPESRELPHWEKEYNTPINKIRYVIDQVIATLNTRRIMHADYRRPLSTFRERISAVVRLHFYRLARITLIVRQTLSAGT